MPFIKSILFLMLLALPFVGNSQLSKTHYIPPLTSAEFGNANPEEQYIYLSTPSAVDIAYTIIPVGQPASSYITGVVSNTNSKEIYIGTGSTQLFMVSSTTSTVTSNKGYIIEAEDVIYVSIRMKAGGGAQAGALVSKGLSALGTTYRVGSFTNENPTSNYLNFVSVMATEDNTQVTFSDLPAGLVIKNYSGATPVTVSLNEGQSYTIATNSFDSTVNRDGLIGALVKSDKNIVVNCGSANGSFSGGGGRDFGLDQIVDLSKVGKEYIFVKGDGSDAWENVLIVAHTDNTAIMINGSSPTAPVAIINAGEYYLIEGDNFNGSGNMYVETSQDVFAYQGISGGGEANQGMFFVPPLSCETRGNLDNIANIEDIGSTVYTGGVSIVSKKGATVTINGNAISGIYGPYDVTGNPDYITYNVRNLTGSVSVQSNDELYCAYYNQNGAATSGSFYSGFPTAPEINFDAEFVTLGICIPNITLSVANPDNFDSFEWHFDDGSGYVGTGISTTDYTPTISGTYKLIGILLCSNLTLESLEVPVSICPDDIDSDGIIDNIDIDNDNDGILNCVESNGDQDINLSNINGGSIPVGGYTYTGIISLLGNAGSTISGAVDGTFLSEVPNKNGTPETNINYDLKFNKNLNLRFEYATSTALGTGLLTDDEEFIIQVPNTRTITLLDPDDQLLVDTNYDGVFESGVIQISSFEIRFKLKNSSLAIGAGTFSFSANSVDGFNYTHINKSDTITNQATFKITATCVANDSDLDGIEDSLDYDSDNDGIPDIIENKGQILVLSNSDSDGDGLDDIFNVTDLPIDTDGDGVFDFLDLDSDNDGIYDLEESNRLSLLPDADFDGMIDGANSTTVGSNGLVDAIETSPDSGVIDYIVSDTDTDAELNYIDNDSDGDNCFDVFEAGFSDTNNDGFLGNAAVVVDVNGVVTNASDGYTIPNNDYLIFAPILIETQPVDTESCELSTTLISVSSATAETYQWEVSTDGGTNYTTIIDDVVYSNSQTNTLQISATPLIYNTYKYRSFLNRAGNACGLYTDEITLTVIKLPVAGIAPTIELCDDDNNGTMPFDLLLQNTFINTVPGMTISYHASLGDADLKINPILSPFETGNTTIYARLENDLNPTCYDVSSFNLEVYDSPFPLDSASISNLSICDDTTVGSDIDGFATFDLTDRATDILNGQLSTEFNLRYFRDALYTNEIVAPNSFPNETVNGQTIYVRMTNNLNTVCFTDTSFEIEVYKLPVINTPNIYSQCDDSTNDGQALFNLTLNSIKEEINANYITEGLTFTYFETQIDAESNGTNIPNPDSYLDGLGFTNETIWIRVENPNGCFRVETIELEVNPSSAALASYNPTSLFQCDDGSDLRDGVSTFDMTDIQNHIETIIFPTFNISVHFYESLSDAELENNEIQNIATHQNTNSPNIQSIWVRVKSDLGNNCLGLEDFPDLLNVEPLPIANALTTFIECDDDQDGVLMFNTSNVESGILNGQSLTDVSISYFDDSWNPLQDHSGTPINSPFPNSFETTSRVIYYTLTNNATNDPDGACFESNALEFIIDQLPINNTVIVPPICDPDPDDGLLIGEFDTSTLETNIGAQPGMDISYFDASMNPLVDIDGNAVLSPFPNTFTSGTQTINVVVTNPINIACPISNTIELVVNSLPEFTVESSRIICESGANSTITLDVIQDDPSEILDYEWTDENGGFISSAQSIDITSSGIYTVTLFKTNGTGCPRSKEINAVYSEKANLDYDDITIVDDSNNNSITINNDGQNLGKGDYEFSLDEFGPFQDEPIFANLIPGIYTVYAKDKNACGVSEIEVSVVGFPKFFSPNNDGQNDNWQVLGINENFYSTSTIYIYDRFGKIIAKVDPLSEGWNGYYNGVMLPSDDYWFSTVLTDNDGNDRIRKGHFSLIRR